MYKSSKKTRMDSLFGFYLFLTEWSDFEFLISYIFIS